MIDFVVYVDRVSGGEVANHIYGYVLIKDKKVRFSAIAFGRFGGQNVSPTLSKKTVYQLRRLGVDSEEFNLELQRKLVEGDITIKAKPPKADWTE